jgi:hypothetical protein
MNTKAKTLDLMAKGKQPEFEIREMMPPFLEGVIKRMVRLNYFYKPNQTKRMLVDYYRTQINNVNKDYYNKIEFPKYEPFLIGYSLIKTFLTGNIIVKLLFTVTTVYPRDLFIDNYQEDLSLIATQLLIALKAYQLETGTLPTSLNELVPKYFSEVPKDLFDGNPIRYSLEKRIIYSVGKDLIDTGGSEERSWQAMEDPTFKIGF